jgi:hypothetical protein
VVPAYRLAEECAPSACTYQQQTLLPLWYWALLGCPLAVALAAVRQVSQRGVRFVGGSVHGSAWTCCIGSN